MTEYVELHCHSNFSLLDGANPPEGLVQQAKLLGMPALALTDHDAVYGAGRFVEACQTHQIKPILGVELTLDTGHHLTLLACNQMGWHNLCTLITHAQHNAPKGKASLSPDVLENHTAGLIALSGCEQGAISQAIDQNNWRQARDLTKSYLDLFGQGNFWIELQNHLLPRDQYRVDSLVELAETMGLDYVATNNVHYATRDKHRLQDILVCIKHQTSLDEGIGLLRTNNEFYLKTARQMHHLFADYPQAIANTLQIAERCQFELTYGLQDLPQYPLPQAISAIGYLKELCEQNLDSKNPATYERLNHELAIIDNAGLSNYFLIVWDIVRFAREQNIRCQGRGSAANSLVAYLLKITPVDPLAHHLVFERFLSAERQLMPDIDIDFDANRREEVIQYIYAHYDTDHAAMACTFVTFRKKSAIRDVGKALGLSPHLVTYITDQYEQEQREVAEITTDIPDSPPPLHQLHDLCEQIKGFPRHLGIHNGGMVITGAPLATRVPTEPATMENRYVVQWDKDGLETAGLVKIDILGLRMLSAIAETVETIEKTYETVLDLDNLPLDDFAIYDTICQADTIGIFQVESRAQQQVLPRLQPRCFADLIVSISLIRPGPVQGNMVHPYLRRRVGEELVTYDHPSLEPVLAETHGVILFQEQVLKVAHVLAGFTHGQGELLRRALGSKNARTEVEVLRQTFMEGALVNEVSPETAKVMFNQLVGFASYSFPKSHAAAFAVLVYQSAWLKYYYPTAFYAALLNNQPMGFWQPAVIVNDAQRHSIETRNVDIQHSQYKCQVEDNHIRLGFNYIPYFTDELANILVEQRAQVPFVSLKGFCQRTRLPRRIIENLIMVGAMDTWDIPRRQLLWELGKLDYSAQTLDLDFADDNIHLPDLTDLDILFTEYDILGLGLVQHPVETYRDWLDKQHILNSTTVQNLDAGHMVRVAGLLVMRQSPHTAKGVTFVTLEDEWGFINVVLRPDLADKYRRLTQNTTLLIAEGQLQRQGEVINIVASKLRSIPEFLVEAKSSIVP